MKPVIRWRCRSTTISCGDSWVTLENDQPGEPRVAFRGSKTLSDLQKALRELLRQAMHRRGFTTSIATRTGGARLVFKDDAVTIEAAGLLYELNLDICRSLCLWLRYLTEDYLKTDDDLCRFAASPNKRTVQLEIVAVDKEGPLPRTAGMQRFYTYFSPEQTEVLVQALLSCAENPWSGPANWVQTAMGDFQLALEFCGADGYRIRLHDCGDEVARWWLGRPSLVRLAGALVEAAGRLPSQPAA